VKATIGAASHPGRKRAGANQDSIAVWQPAWLSRRPSLLALADGMGGHSGGSIASGLVVQAFLDYYRSAPIEQDIASILQEAVQSALAAVQARSRKDEALTGMGSTVVAVALGESRLTLVNVGDSRAYLARGDKLTQLSWDHSLVGELIRRGVITPQEALTHPRRSQLTMSISGQRSRVEPYSYEGDLLPEDQVLLCSDGLWAVIPEDQILSVVLHF
jgi:serine/threonine protein phosphatase PrpC